MRAGSAIDAREFGSDVSVRPYVRPSVRTLKEGEGRVRATRPGEENVIFSWREIARCFRATSAAKRLFDSVEFFFKLEKKYQISINGKKKFKRILSCLFGGRRKVQVTKFALEDFIFVVDSAANLVGTTLEHS